MKIVLVVGARPNFVKIKPVLDELEGRGHDCELVHTGQHYDPLLSDIFFEELGIRSPDRHLNTGSGSQARQVASVMIEFEPCLEDLRPDSVVVVGDVNSTVACAVVAAKSGADVVHLEAGLRSRDWSMPEEVNRVLTDRVSDLLLAPSEDAVVNLNREGYRPDQIALVGNVMIDTLLANIERARARTILSTLGLDQLPYGLVTLHRPANVDSPLVLGRIIEGLNRLAGQVQLVLPAHPRSRAKLRDAGIDPGISLIDPLGYLDFVALQDAARIVLTDSGGVQEETTVLGVPCLTLRENTERPITVSEGTNTLVGTDPDLIVSEALKRLEGGHLKRRPDLWDGKAGVRTADAIEARLGAESQPRPTDT